MISKEILNFELKLSPFGWKLNPQLTTITGGAADEMEAIQLSVLVSLSCFGCHFALPYGFSKYSISLDVVVLLLITREVGSVHPHSHTHTHTRFKPNNTFELRRT